MGLSWFNQFCVHYFLVLLVLLNATQYCFSSVQTKTLCHDDERSALLQFKQVFTIVKSASLDPSACPKLASWSTQEGDHNKSSCCSWDGVECDADSGHVIGLYLSSSCLYGSINSNSTLFQLVHLQRLDLSDNNLHGRIPRSLFHHLQNLEYLDLSKNNLSGVVEFDEFSKLPKVRELRLSSNKLSVQIKTSFKATAPQFEVLTLGSCNLTKFPEFLNDQHKLQELDLSDNQIHGQIPKWMWKATRETLQFLNLAHNFLTGFEQSPATLPWLHLVVLDLGFNKLQGSLPIPSPSISVYSLPNNDYTGEIPPPFCNSSVVFLDLSNNKLSGMLPQCFGNFRSLLILKLRSNSFRGRIPQMCSREHPWLRMFDLSYNQFQGMLPRSLANCTLLEFLNVENNQITDIFPSWLGELPQLRILILRSNRFHGIIGKPATNNEFRELCVIDISNNAISGMLPSNYFDNWNCMKSVDQSEQTYMQQSLAFTSSKAYRGMYNFHYSMTIFAKGVELNYLKTPYRLRVIDLSSNRFEGEIPAGAIGNLRQLHFVDLSNNILTGLIPSSLSNLTFLESLDLSRNQLSGNIPSNLTQLNFLEYFNVSHNYLWGPIPHGQQFDTFQEESYQGNSGLCGKPLSKKCENSEPPPPSKFEEDEDSGFQIELDWYVVLPGVVSGLVVGGVTGNIFATKNHAWFVKTFSRRKQPRGTRRRRG